MKCSRVDTRVFQNLLKNTIGSSLNKTSLLRIVTITSFEQNINITACKNSDHSWTSSLPAPVAFRETPLGPRAKKDGCFRRLTTIYRHVSTSLGGVSTNMTRTLGNIIIFVWFID